MKNFEQAFGDVIKEMKESDYYSYEMDIKKETEKAFLISINISESFYEKELKEVWAPKSVCRINKEQNIIEIKKWYADKINI